MIAIFLLIYREEVGPFPSYTVGYVLLAIATLLTLWSMVVYLRAAWPTLRGDRSSDAGDE